MAEALSIRLQVKIVALFFVMLCMVLPQWVFAAQKTVKQMETAVPVDIPTKTLVAKGCVQPKRVPNNSFNPFSEDLFEFPDGYYHIISTDGFSLDASGNTITLATGRSFGLYCSPDVRFDDPDIQAAKLNKIVTNKIELLVIQILNAILAITGNLGLWLLSVAGKFMMFFLSQGSFITHPFVRMGWPFLQGIANIGFLLALLFIAAGTTLQLESWSFRKALPRLLFAALMINFSLVVAGILIDASRVLMAIMVRLMAGTNMSELATGIVKNSNILKGLIDITGSVHAPGNYSWNIPLSLLQANMVIYSLAIGMSMVAVALVARHIAIIVLLIFSPLAWLALAFPNTKDLCKKWWTHFLKWVFYGPILLFFLLLVTAVGAGFDIAQLKQQQSSFAPLLEVGITTALLLVAYKQGKGIAGNAGDGLINFATRWGKAAPGMIYRNPKTAAALAATVATGGLGGAGLAAGLAAAGGIGLGQKLKPIAGQYIKREASYRTKQAKDALGISAVGDYFGEKRKIVDRQRAREEEQRRRTSGGVLLAQERFDTPAYDRNIQSRQWVQETRAATAYSDVGLDAKHLRSKDVQKAVSGDQLKTIVAQTFIDPSTTKDQIEVIVATPDLVAKLDEDDLENLTSTLKGRAASLGTSHLGPMPGEIEEKKQIGALLAELNRSLREAARQAGQSTPPPKPAAGGKS